MPRKKQFHDNGLPIMPLRWFKERIGKRIKRVAGGNPEEDSYTIGLIVWFKTHAEYLYECQERGYRYADHELLNVEVRLSQKKWMQV